jgi:hypothetical protein
MKFLHWKIQLGLALIGASARLYALNTKLPSNK